MKREGKKLFFSRKYLGYAVAPQYKFAREKQVVLEPNCERAKKGFDFGEVKLATVTQGSLIVTVSCGKVKVEKLGFEFLDMKDYVIWGSDIVFEGSIEEYESCTSLRFLDDVIEEVLA